MNVTLNGQIVERIQLYVTTNWKPHLLAARWVWVPLVAFSLSRLGIALIAYLAAPLIIDSPVPPYHIRPDNTLLDVFGSLLQKRVHFLLGFDGHSNR